MIILLTGQKGSGKTTTAIKIVSRLKQEGITVGGVVCPGIFSQNRKIGIKCHHLANDYEEVLGMERYTSGKPVVESTGPDSFSFGRWEFSSSALATADEAIITDLKISPFVVVDEIGPLELDFSLGMSKSLARLDIDREINNCTILVCARSDLKQHLLTRWPGAIPAELAGETSPASNRAENILLKLIGLTAADAQA